MYLATRNFNQGVELYMNITAGIFLKATGSEKQSKQHNYIIKNKTILHITLRHKRWEYKFEFGSLQMWHPQPRWPNDIFKPSPHSNTSSGHCLQRRPGGQRTPCLGTHWPPACGPAARSRSSRACRNGRHTLSPFTPLTAQSYLIYPS